MTQRWARLWAQRRLLTQAALALLGAGVRVNLTRGARLAAALGEPVPEVGLALSAEQIATAREVGWAIELLAVRGPLRTACLGQALAARTLLRRRGVPYHLTVGLERAPNGRLRAHAWLRAGDFTVTGGRGRSVFTPLARFH